MRASGVERVVEAAIDVLAARGFHGTSTRDVAARAGLSPSAVYVHFATKRELLAEIARRAHLEVLDAMEGAAAGASTPRQRLVGLAAAHAEFHARRPLLARVANHELHALAPSDRAHVDGLRARIGRLMEDAVREGAEAGVFDVESVPGTATAILSLGIDVCRWYVPGSRLTPVALGRLYAGYAERLAGAR